ARCNLHGDGVPGARSQWAARQAQNLHARVDWHLVTGHGQRAADQQPAIGFLAGHWIMTRVILAIRTFLALSLPYFRSEDRWRAALLLAAVVAAELGLVYVAVA